MAKNQLVFPVVAIDEATRTFERIAKATEKLTNRLDRMEAKQASAAANADKPITPDPKKVEDSDRALQHLQKTFDALAGVMGKVAGLAAKFGAFSVIAGGAAAAGVKVAQLVAALVPLAGAIAGIPAVVGVYQAAMATIRVATIGLAEAFQAAAEGDAEKLAEALEKISPKAGDAVKAFAALKPQLDAFRMAVQDAAFAQAAVSMEMLAATLLGPLTTGMTSAAAAGGQLLFALTQVAASSAGVDFVNGSFAVLTRILDAVRPGLEVVFRSLLRIGFQVQEAFGADAVARIGELTTKLGQFFQNAADTGRALAWVQGALDTFAQLKGVIAPIAGIIQSIGGAATSTGGSLLTIVGTLLSSVDAFLKSTAGQQVLTALFDTLAQIGTALTPIIAALGGALAKILPSIGGIAAALGPGLTALIDALGTGLGSVAPALVPIAAALAGIAQAAAPILPILGRLIALVAGVLSTILAAAGPAIQKIFEQVGPAIEDLMPAIEEFAGILGEIGAEVLVSLGEALAELLPQLLDLASIMIDEMLPVWRDMGSKIIELIPKLFELAMVLVEALLPVLTDLLPVWMEFQAAIGGLVIEALAALIPLLVLVVENATPIIEIVVALIAILLELVTGALEVVIGAITNLIAWIGDMATSIRDSTGGIREWVGKVVGAITGFGEKVKSKLDMVIDWFRKLPGRILASIKDLGRMLWEQGKALIQGLINGITSKVNELRSTLGNITSLIPTWKGPLALDRVLLTPAGTSIMGGLMDGIASQVPALRAQLGGITAMVASPQTMSAASAISAAAVPVAGGGAQTVTVVLDVRGGDAELKSLIRRWVHYDGGGSVQKAFGATGRA